MSILWYYVLSRYYTTTYAYESILMILYLWLIIMGRYYYVGTSKIIIKLTVNKTIHPIMLFFGFIII